MSSEPVVGHVVSRCDWDDFVAICYFGQKGDWLDRCIQRAYLDMSRTLRRQGSSDEVHTKWRKFASKILRNRLLELPKRSKWDNRAFDEWHHESVNDLQQASVDQKVSLYVGQCQKWINMSIKYAIALGECRIPGFSGAYEVAHVPLDSVVLNEFKSRGMRPLPDTWSRIPEYGEYMSCQLWVRANLPGIPLEIEYWLWREGAHKNA